MTVTLAAAAPAPASPEERDGRGPDLAILGLVFLLLVAASPQTYAWFVAPKAVVVLALLGPGLVSLALAARVRDRASILAACFLGVCVASTLWSDVPVMSLVGTYREPNGMLFVAALVGAWSLGRRLSSSARTQLVPVIVVAALVNAVVGCVQVYFDLGAEWLRPFEDRALGLVGNPVQLGALCSAAAYLAAERSLRSRSRRPRVAYLLAEVVLVAAVELSGSRVALLGVAVAVGFLLVRFRAAAAPLAAAAVVAVALTMALPPQVHSGSSARIAEGSSTGLSSRVHTWVDGLDALVDRPLLGYGPGRFYVAATPRTSLASARYTGGDVLYGEAHNILVQYLVTTGLLGFAFGVAWVISAARRARGPLVGFCLLVVLSLLLEPQYLGVTPVVALALGAAHRPTVPGPAESWRWGRTATAIAVVLGLLGAAIGGVAFAGDVRYARAFEHQSARELDQAESLLPPWPQVPALRSALFASSAERLRSAVVGREAIRAERGAIDRDPADPQWWLLRGRLEESFGSPAAADAAYRAALRRNPWSAQAMQSRMRLASKRDDGALVERLRTRLCELGRATCLTKREVERARTGASSSG